MKIAPRVSTHNTAIQKLQHTQMTQFGSVHSVVFHNIPPKHQQYDLLQTCLEMERKTGSRTEPLYLYQPIVDCFEKALAATRNLREAFETANLFALANNYPNLTPEESSQIPIKAYLFHDDENYADATQLLTCGQQGTSPLELYISARTWSQPYSTLHLEEILLEDKPTLIITEIPHKMD